MNEGSLIYHVSRLYHITYWNYIIKWFSSFIKILNDTYNLKLKAAECSLEGLKKSRERI